MPTPSPLSPVLGLPTYRGNGEEVRLLRLLTAAPQGLSFGMLARESADGVATYGALFALLTRGAVLSVELPDGQVGYRRRGRRRGASAVAHAEPQLALAA